MQALETAALAWAMVSSLIFGAWDMPHMKTPSVAKSTGRSLTCASRKKPSWFVGTFSIWPMAAFSGLGTVPTDRARMSARRSTGSFSTGSKTLTVTLPPSTRTSGLRSSSKRTNFTLSSRAFL